MRDGVVTRISAEELVPGDIVLLEPGTASLHCRLIEAFSVRVNNAAVTGESMPKPREAAASQALELLESRNVALAGTAIVSGRARGVVFATGARTEFGKIARLTQATGAEVPEGLLPTLTLSLALATQRMARRKVLIR
jgi:magnesium-transporting ATPase (P-type)